MESHSSSLPHRIHERRELFYQDVRKAMARRYKAYDPLASEVCFNVAQAFALMEDRLERAIKPAGLTLPGLNLLIILHQYRDTGCPLNRLSDLLVVTRANITGLVDSLVKKGLVSRQDHATDRRVVLARITAKGEALLNTHLSQHHRAMQESSTMLSAADKSALVRILSKIRKGLLGQQEK